MKLLFLPLILDISLGQIIREREVYDMKKLWPKSPDVAQGVVPIDFDDIEVQKTQIPSKQIYANMKKRIESVVKSCGKVCDTSVTGPPGKYYDVLKKEVDCPALFSNPDIDAPGEFVHPPTTIPKYLLSNFTYDGKLTVQKQYRDDANGVTHFDEWPLSMFEHLRKRYDEGILSGSYGVDVVAMIKQYIDDHVSVEGKDVLVIGAQAPWMETILLAKGAKFITTFDYVKIVSGHPQVEMLLPEELSVKYLKENVQYDVVVTFSSLEHSGLGRYGDMLNPWGDLIAMARAWCLVKPGGKALVGVPTGPDLIMFNSHRLYGPIAYSHLFANWDQEFTDNDFTRFFEDNCDHCYQPLHVLSKPI